MGRSIGAKGLDCRGKNVVLAFSGSDALMAEINGDLSALATYLARYLRR